ncbi:DUF4260 domain-containing protein [Kallotenue papyrolyticum]|uniref:DUF4260 domain-containing protein n=1 Tax=Kallotenue papyrolyticum TaxID=1325125 RepID=UPI0004AE4182|nr:DUF4260 domain-containing protein [Kallotenue papyrolyticum]
MAQASTKRGPADGLPINRPAWLLRGEGAALLALALILYRQTGASWLLFALVLFVPDLARLGYLAGPRLGAIAYNTLHTTILPLLLLGWGGLDRSPPPLLAAVALVWLAHIGMDRALGYGLKYPHAFTATHLQRV